MKKKQNKKKKKNGSEKNDEKTIQRKRGSLKFEDSDRLFVFFV